jgi:hypothetical protein
MNWSINGKIAPSLTLPFVGIGTSFDLTVYLLTDLDESMPRCFLSTLFKEHAGIVQVRIAGKRVYQDIMWIGDTSAYLGTITENSAIELQFRITVPSGYSGGRLEIPILVCSSSLLLPDQTFCGKVDSLPEWGDEEEENPLWTSGSEGCPGFVLGSLCGGPETARSSPGEDIEQYRLVYLDPIDRKFYKATRLSTEKEASVIGILVGGGADLLTLDGSARLIYGTLLYESGGEEVDENGNHLGIFYDEIRVFNLVSQSWEVIGECGGLRKDHVMAYYDGALYLWGGQSDESELLSTLYRFDLETKTCTELTAGGIARVNATVTVYQDEIHITGGTTLFGIPVTDTNIYVVGSDSWISIPLYESNPPPEDGSDNPADYLASTAPKISEPSDWTVRKAPVGYEVGNGCGFKWTNEDGDIDHVGSYYLLRPYLGSQIYLSYFDAVDSTWTVFTSRDLAGDGLGLDDLVVVVNSFPISYPNARIYVFPRSGGTVVRTDIYRPDPKTLLGWATGTLSGGFSEITMAFVSDYHEESVHEIFVVFYGNTTVGEESRPWIGFWPWTWAVKSGSVTGISTDGLDATAGVLVGDNLNVWNTNGDNWTWKMDFSIGSVPIAEGPSSWLLDFGPPANYKVLSIGYLDGNYYFCIHKTDSPEYISVWRFDGNNWTEGESRVLLDMGTPILTIAGPRFFYLGQSGETIQHASFRWDGSVFASPRIQYDFRGTVTRVVFRYSAKPTVRHSRVGTLGCYRNDYSSLSWGWGYDAIVWDAEDRTWTFLSDYNIRYQVEASWTCERIAQPSYGGGGNPGYLPVCGVIGVPIFGGAGGFGYAPVMCSPYSPFMYLVTSTGQLTRIPLSGISVQTGGFVTNPEWEWVGEGQLYLDDDGLMIEERPDSGNITIVGRVINPTTICLDPQYPK